MIVEVRSATAGVGSFTFKFDHMAELTGRTADQIVAARKAPRRRKRRSCRRMPPLACRRALAHLHEACHSRHPKSRADARCLL